MRIIIAFLIGLILSFYLADVLSRLKRKYFLNSLPSFQYSFLGLTFLLSSLAGIVIFSASPNPNPLLASIFLLGSGLGLIVHHLLTKQYIFSQRLEQNFVRHHEYLFVRLFEILPGALVWIAITSPIWLSYTLPFAVAYLIILADVYWLINALKIAVLIYLGYKKMDFAKSQNWLKKLSVDFPDQWSSYYHLLVLPTYKESLAVLGPAFEAIANSHYPKEKIFLAVGFEAWDDPEKIKIVSKYLNDNIAGKIARVFISIHPDHLPGEIHGPGSNRNWMINNALPELKKRGIDQDKVFVTTLDADFVIHPQFLAGALHKYLSTPESERDKRSYTGVFLYYSNYWQAPTPMRLIAAGTSFWQLAEMVGSDKYRNFASLSINLKSLINIGLWMVDKVNDDSGFYWKAYFHFSGNYKVIPHYLPIYADTVLDVNLIKTFQNQYLQQKRWAYGVEHLPYVIERYFKSQNVDFWDKTDKLFFAIWGYVRWGMLALFVTFAGLAIPLVNPHYNQSVVAYNLPIVSSWILTAAFLGMLATIYVHEKTVPKRPANWSLLKRIWSYVQWLMVPVIMVTISSIPVIDALTALMLGRYLEFRVTTKARVNVS